MIRSYLGLCKLRVVALMLLTAVVGMLLAAPAAGSWWLMLRALWGIALVSCAGAVVNHLVDQEIDARMARTQHRPLPSGAVSPRNAGIFAGCLGCVGLWVLWFYVSVVTALLALFALMGYGLVYTVFLKRATPQNIVMGGLAGAMPPLLGWTAVTGQVDPHSLLLVLIVFTWTPPHFWALAIYRCEEYRRAQVPMLPVTHGVALTKLYILCYTVLLVLVTLLPFWVGMCGVGYLVGAVLLNMGFLYYALRLYRSDAGVGDKRALQTFHYSIVYLGLLFVMMLVDRLFTVLSSW